MDNITVTLDTPAGWREALARSDGQLAAGQLVTGDDVMREAQETVARLQVRQRESARLPG
jgi:hypothetical protein